MAKSNRSPTTRLYGAFDSAFDFLNRRFFENRLPSVVFILIRKPNGGGRAWSDRYLELDGKGGMIGDYLHEISLNPTYFDEDGQEGIFSTIAHEMVHIEEFISDHPPRSGCHGRWWSDRMREIGLIPSDTGEPGGNDVGNEMSHYIEPGGVFAKAVQELLDSGCRVPFIETIYVDEMNRKMRRKATSQVRFDCPTCGTNVRSKPSSRIICGNCVECMSVDQSISDELENKKRGGEVNDWQATLEPALREIRPMLAQQPTAYQTAKKRIRALERELAAFRPKKPVKKAA